MVHLSTPTGVAEEANHLRHSASMDLFAKSEGAQLYALTSTLLDTSSDEEEPRREHGGSLPGKAANLNRERHRLGDLLHRQYFATDPIYNHETFMRRFRVSRAIFDHLFDAAKSNDDYFVQRPDCTGQLGLSTFQKVTAAMRIIAYGTAADAVDEKLGISESTALECVMRFCDVVIDTCEAEYLRSPTEADVARLLTASEKRGFPGMLGSIDCSKWRWKNCPTAFHGHYKGKEKTPAVTLEAIVDRSMWIWHAFFGMPGCLNDINVVEASPLSEKISSGTYPPPCEYMINGIRSNKPYWLCDSIYPKWPVFIGTILQAISRKHKYFATMQEAARKDVERAFGVLQSKWHILVVPSRLWGLEDMKRIMKCTIILHNMVVEERMFAACEDGEEISEGVVVGEGRPPMWGGLVQLGGAVTEAAEGSIAAMCALQAFKEKEVEHDRTKRLLVDHLWERHGQA